MKAKIQSQAEFDADSLDLPSGSSTATSPTPAIVEPKEELFDDNGVSQENKKKVWYVVLSRAEFPADLMLPPRHFREWRWAHTKSWARTLAKKARDEGWTVVDIFPGTKTHISNLYRGLK